MKNKRGYLNFEIPFLLFAIVGLSIALIIITIVQDHQLKERVAQNVCVEKGFKYGEYRNELGVGKIALCYSDKRDVGTSNYFRLFREDFKNETLNGGIQ